MNYVGIIYKYYIYKPLFDKSLIETLRIRINDIFDKLFTLVILHGRRTIFSYFYHDRNDGKNTIFMSNERDQYSSFE